jgi:hypothetical protein
MWKNFLLSIALLAIALLAALYSSSVANDGRTLAAGYPPFSLTAGDLGCHPLRAATGQRRPLELDPGLAHYKLTKDGVIFLSSVVVVVIAAVNTSNNLLYMVLSVLIAVFVLSIFLLELNFKVSRSAGDSPHRCTTGESFSFSIQIYNRRRVFPMISVRVEPSANSLLSLTRSTLRQSIR